MGMQRKSESHNVAMVTYLSDTIFIAKILRKETNVTE